MESKKHLFISIIILLLLGSNIYSVVLVSQNIVQLKESSLNNTDNDELVTIKAIIDENIDKAMLQAESVKNLAEQDILNAYPDNNTLRQDLSSVGDKIVYHILQDNITGKYLNVTNDNNDMWVWIPELGKVSDTSKNCAFEKGELVTKEGEVNKQNNKVLAELALTSIINQENKKYIFWNFLPTPDGFYQPQSMDMSEIDKLYSLYGYKGLQYLEFLYPAYLRQNEDITGVKDVNQNGIKTENSKIIFVQGFNVVDDLERNHPEIIQYYENSKAYTISKYDMTNNAIRAFGILTSIILLVGFLSIVRDINKT